METKHDITKMATDIKVLKFQLQCLQRDNNMLMAHIGKTADKLAGHIEDTNERLNKRIDKTIDYAHHISKDLARDGRVTLNHLMRVEETVEQLQAHIMPSVTAFENDVANIIGAPSYEARERPRATPAARSGTLS